MERKLLAFLVSCLFPWMGFSRASDYLITQTGDTLLGKVSYHPFKVLLASKPHCIRTTEGERIWFHTHEVKEYRYRRRIYVIVYDSVRGEKLRYICRVLVDGPARLLVETDRNPRYFLYLRDTLYSASRQEQAWSQLTGCPAFEETYGHYREKYLKKRMLFFPGQMRLWQEMLGYYNDKCR